MTEQVEGNTAYTGGYGAQQMQASYPDPEMQFYDALAAAQANFAPIHRSRTVKVALKTGGAYTFAYAPLETILAATVPALAKQGLSLQQRIRIDTSFEEPIHYLQTILRKGRYEVLNEVMIFKTDATSQAYGGSVTYARRLGVTLLLCVAADDDNDGSEANLTTAPVQKRDLAHDYDQRPEAHKPASALKQTVLATDPGTEITDKERADLDAWILDLKIDLIEAANEGRRVGVESVWQDTREAKHREYVQTMLWRQIKAEAPDAFKTINAILKPPSDKGPRGPKPNDSAPQ